ARLTASPGLSQSSTPFIASWRQDIPHQPLVAWPHGSCPPPRVATTQRSEPLPDYCPNCKTVGESNDPFLSLRLFAERFARTAAVSCFRKTQRLSLKMQLLPLPNCQRTSRNREGLHG